MCCGQRKAIQGHVRGRGTTRSHTLNTVRRVVELDEYVNDQTLQSYVNHTFCICLETLRPSWQPTDRVRFILGLRNGQHHPPYSIQALRTRITVPSPLVVRSTVLGFFPRTESSLLDAVLFLMLSLRTLATALVALTSSISVDALPLSAENVCSFSVLRCLLALGC